MTSWTEALKKWNGQRVGSWRVPRKGTEEYNEVRALMGKSKLKSEARAPKEEKPVDYEKVKRQVEAVEEVKKIGKKEKVKSFLAKLIEMKKKKKEEEAKRMKEQEEAMAKMKEKSKKAPRAKKNIMTAKDAKEKMMEHMKSLMNVDDCQKVKLVISIEMMKE